MNKNMEDKKVLSEVLDNIINQVEKGNEFIKCKEGDEIHNIACTLYDNYNIIGDATHMNDGSINYPINNTFKNEINYIKNFLLMCEDLFEGKIPKINRFNKRKFDELEGEGIIDIIKNQEKISDIETKDKYLLEDEYYNIRYKTKKYNFGNIYNRFDKSSNVNINNSNISNSTIQLNCTINEQDIEEIVKTIFKLVVDDNTVPLDTKTELMSYRNSKDKSKLIKTLEAICNTSKDVATGVLSNVLIEAISSI